MREKDECMQIMKYIQINYVFLKCFREITGAIEKIQKEEAGVPTLHVN